MKAIPQKCIIDSVVFALLLCIGNKEVSFNQFIIPGGTTDSIAMLFVFLDCHQLDTLMTVLAFFGHLFVWSVAVCFALTFVENVVNPKETWNSKNKL